MNIKPILTINDGSLNFGETTIFNNLNSGIYPGDRICLVGSNGTGKSTLLKVIAGIQELSSGRVWNLPGLSIGYLPQSVKYEHTDLNALEYITTGHDLGAENLYKVDIITAKLKVDKTRKLHSLSGGELRKAALCRTLLLNHDLLLLDEPTNHLDISSIEWLEDYLSSFKGSLICISHDRAFLKSISNKILWLDRSKMHILNKNYAYYEDWSNQVIEAEEKELERLNKRMQTEEVWLRQGITARRKRNQKRLKELYQLRERLQSQKSGLNSFKQQIEVSHQNEFAYASKLAVEFKNVSKTIGDNIILDNFDWKIIKGDKIGIIGNNGTGKSTFLKVLVGNTDSTSGSIRRAENLDITYVSQSRDHIDMEETPWKLLAPSGGDYIQVGSKYLHVVAYLKQFLFDPKTAKTKIGNLSGGQINRLLLAKALAAPGNLLILDEPTNDLDVDTLDMLQEILTEYSGTLLIVSHDRDFLDRLVTQTLVFDGRDNPQIHIGCYEEYRSSPAEAPVERHKKETTVKKVSNNKPSYKLIYEYEQLPEQIKEIESKIRVLESEMGTIDQSNLAKLREKSVRLGKLQNELEQKEERWLEIVEKIESY